MILIEFSEVTSIPKITLDLGFLDIVQNETLFACFLIEIYKLRNFVV
jgi:hypothetical protein